MDYIYNKIRSLYPTSLYSFSRDTANSLICAAIDCFSDSKAIEFYIENSFGEIAEIFAEKKELSDNLRACFLAQYFDYTELSDEAL